MDKDDRLELMKKKILALQEQRKKIDLKNDEISADVVPFITHISNQTHDHSRNEAANVETVSISIQTDEIAVTELTLSKEPIITYDKAIQTEYFGSSDEIVSSNASENNLPKLRESRKQGLNETNVPQDGAESKSEDDGQDETHLKPLVVEQDGLSLNTQTFSLQESIEASLKPVSRHLDGDSRVALSHSISPEIKIDETAKCRYISCDYYQGMVVSIAQLESKYVKSSLVQVSHIRSGHVIDSVLFQGQRLVRAKFISTPNSKITTILLTCYNGRAILYELRSVAYKSTFKIERNIIYKNFHHYPVFAILNENLGDHSVLLASTSGQIKLLSTLDLTLKQENNVKILPLSRTDLNYSGKSLTLEDKFNEHLLLTSLYDELSILCVLIVSSDMTSLYVGCEDGFIYKLGPLPLKPDNNGTLKIDLRNNGFIPTQKFNSESDSIFHSGPVTGMRPCTGFEGIFFSYSIDGSCNFWDTIEMKKLGTIDCGMSIIHGEWFSFQDHNYAVLMTCDCLRVYKIEISKTVDNITCLGESISPALSIFTEETPLSRFCCFQIISEKDDKDGFFITLVGDDWDLHCYSINSM